MNIHEYQGKELLRRYGVAVQPRVAQVLARHPFGEQRDGAVLVGQRLAVLEGQVEELPRGLGRGHVVTGGDRRIGGGGTIGIVFAMSLAAAMIRSHIIASSHPPPSA